MALMLVLSCLFQELLRLWLRVQRHVEDDSALFLQSVEKVAAVAPNANQNVLLVTVLYSEVRERIFLPSYFSDLEFRNDYLFSFFLLMCYV